MYQENIYPTLILILLQVERHLKSKCHQIALEIKNGKPPNERAIDTLAGLSQTRVDDMSLEHVSTREAYVRLMNTAYELTVNPTMSLRPFEMMITVQRNNGVQFISGKV